MLSFILKIFYGVILFLLGFYGIKYRKKVIGWTGRFLWAEKYLGNGGTYLVIILVCLFLMFIGVLYPFGGMELLFGKPGDVKFHGVN